MVQSGPRKRQVLLRQIAPHLSGNGTLVLGNAGANHRSVCTEHTAPAVLIRRQIRGQVINIWLVLIVALGAVIAVGDGLTRAPNLELESSPLQPLEYEPYHAALLLAGLTFPLMFAYVKKARASLSEGLFLWFAFCTTAYMKDFSYLRWPGTPLFVTDVVLILLLLSIYIVPRHRSSSIPLLLTIPLGLFMAAGALAAARGFLGRGESILVLRDSALIAYALFLLIGFHLFRDWLAIRRVAVWFVLGSALSVLNGLAWLVVAPEQRRFVLPGIYVLVSLIGVLVMMVNRLIRPKVGWILAAIFSLGLLLANMRSLFVSLAVVFLLALMVPGLLLRKARSVWLVTRLGAVAGLVCLCLLPFPQQQAGQDFTARVADNMASGILHTSDDPYWQFRLMAWKEAWRRFKEYPPAGEGFGIPFKFDIWDNDPRPHNTFLTVLYKMGLIGFLPLLAILASFFSLGLKAIHRNSPTRSVALLQVAVLSQISFCVYAGGSYLLESPYLASLFWAGMGVGLRMFEKYDFEQSVRAIASHGGLKQRSGFRNLAIRRATL
jgi:O-antigen ligase